MCPDTLVLGHCFEQSYQSSHLRDQSALYRIRGKGVRISAYGQLHSPLTYRKWDEEVRPRDRQQKPQHLSRGFAFSFSN